MGEEGGYFRASQRPWARRLSVFVIAMLLVGVFAVLVTAPTVSGATPPGPTPTVAPLRELTIGSEGLTIATTNPLQATLVDEYYLWTVVYSALINLGPSFEYEPDIAVRWQKVSDFPTTKFEFWIAKNAYWVDPALCTADATGRIISCPTTARTPVTANDVKFTYDYIFKNKNRTAYMGPCIDRLKVDAAGDPVGAVVIDDYHMTIEFSVTYAPAMYTFVCLPILPKHIWEGKAPDWANDPPVGSGSYLARPGRRPPIYMDRNPFWHGPEVLGRQAYTNTILYESYTNTATMTQDLAAGVIDLAISPSGFEYNNFLATKPGIIRQKVPGTFVAEMAINVMPDDLRSLQQWRFGSGHTDPILANEQVVRWAILMATDRTKMINNALLGYGSPADTIAPSNHAYHLEIPEYNPDDKDGDGSPIDVGREEFPEGPEDFDGNGRPDAIELARRMLHDADWLYDCGTGGLDTGVSVPLCRKSATGQMVDKLEFDYATFNTPLWWKTAADGVVEDAAKVGIKLNMQLLNTNQMGGLWWQLDYDIWLWDWVLAPSLDISTGILSVQLCGQIFEGQGNDNGYCPRDADGKWVFDELYNQSLTETDLARRRGITDRLQQMVYDYGAYNLPFYLHYLYAMNEVRWTNWGDFAANGAIPPDAGNPPVIGTMVYPVDQKPPQFDLALFRGVTNRAVQFSVSATDPEGGALRYRWDFDTSSEPGGADPLNNDGVYGNDNQASTATPTFTYTTPSVRQIAVRVFEDGGEWFTVKKTTVDVRDAVVDAPRINGIAFSPSDPTTSALDPVVTFAASAYDPAGRTITSYQWDFQNDGTWDATGLRASFRYTTTGVKTVKLRVTNDAGVFREDTTLVNVVANTAPSVAPLESVQVSLDAANSYVAFASDLNRRDVLSYEWDFGDGTGRFPGNPVSHAYGSVNTFTVTVYVSDGKGNTASRSATVDVLRDVNHGPSVNLVAPTSSWTGQEITLAANVSDPEGNPLLWEWDTDGDGDIDVSENTSATIRGQYVLRSQDVTYTTVTTAKPRLTVTDIPPGGTAHPGWAEVSITVRLNRAPALGDISASPTSGSIGDTFTFSLTSTDADGNACSYRWDWGDGTAAATGTTSAFCTGGGLSPRTHVYDEAGEFLVTLEADDGRGGVSRESALVVVEAPVSIEVSLAAQWPKIAVGQSMEIVVTATVEGAAAAGANAAGSALSGSVSPSSGTTDDAGVFRMTFTPDFLVSDTMARVSATVSKSGLGPGTAFLDILVKAEPESMAMTASSNRVEMMGNEVATISVGLRDLAGTPLDGGVLSATGIGGSFGSPRSLGGGNYAIDWKPLNRSTQGYLSLSLLAKVGGYSDARGRVTILIDPNKTNPTDPTPLLVLGLPDKTSLLPGETIGLRVYVYTTEGYVVSGAGLSVTVFPTIYGTVTVVVDRLNGLYTFSFTASSSITSPVTASIRLIASKYGYANSLTARVTLSIAP